MLSVCAEIATVSVRKTTNKKFTENKISQERSFPLSFYYKGAISIPLQ